MKTRQIRLSGLGRLGAAVCCATLVIALGACTTTTRQTVDARPLTRNSAPNAMSELRIADTALESGNIELATSLYEKTVQADPHSVAGLTGLGNTLYAVGDFTRAGVYYNRASQIDANALAPLMGLARVALRQRRFDDAISTYRRLLVLTPDEPLASAGLGAAYDMKGDHAGAQAVLRTALAKNVGDPLISVNLGLSLVLGGDPREGANVLLDVTRFPAAPPQARQDLALAYGMLGNREAAAEILSRDLPKASVEDNLRYYDIQRELMSQPTSAVSPSQPTAPAAIPTAQVQTTRIK
jgi:Flp pilus assembly protein TadD